MSKPAVSKGHSRVMLTTVEKYDGFQPGFATEARMLLDRGISTRRAAEILGERFQVQITESAVKQYRTKRWLPERIKRQEESRTMEGIYTRAGGERGLDLLAFARIRELLEAADIKEANTIRLTLLKIRDQNLKEEEFKFKCKRKGEGSDAMEESGLSDPDEKTKRVMNRVRAIFALPALPEVEAAQACEKDAGGETEECAAEQVDRVAAAEQVSEP